MITRPIIALRTLGTSKAARSLRKILPRSLRALLHRVKISLDQIPLRIVLPQQPEMQTTPVRIVIFGSFAANWLARLSEPKTWQEIPAVTEVLMWPDDPTQLLPTSSSADSRTVVIPLSEDNILNCPPGFDSLVPDRHAVSTLRNKASFAEYAEEARLAEFCPVWYKRREQVAYPCIVKYVSAAFGFGSRILRSEAELDDFLRTEPWDHSKFIVQHFIENPVEYVTHCVCTAGRILWSCTFAFENETGEKIRRGIVFKSMTSVAAPEGALAAIERVLQPLAYDGPCSVDYTRAADGRIMIFEINARFGGTLMLERNVSYLRQALDCIITNAGPAA